jgi:hypothetical protein
VVIDFRTTRIGVSTANSNCARLEAVEAIELALHIAANSVASSSVKTGSLCIVSKSTPLSKLFAASAAKHQSQFGTA